MARTDANPPMMPYTDDYTLVEVDADYLSQGRQAEAVHPHRPDRVHPCARAASTSARGSASTWCRRTRSSEATGTEQPGDDPSDNVIFIIDDDICTRCALCVDRCPTGVIILGKVGAPDQSGDLHTRTNNHGYAYGMRL